MASRRTIAAIRNIMKKIIPVGRFCASNVIIGLSSDTRAFAKTNSVIACEAATTATKIQMSFQSFLKMCQIMVHRLSSSCCAVTRGARQSSENRTKRHGLRIDGANLAEPRPYKFAESLFVERGFDERDHVAHGLQAEPVLGDLRGRSSFMGEGDANLAEAAIQFGHGFLEE